MDIEDSYVESPNFPQNITVHSRFIKKKSPVDPPKAIGDNIPGTQRIFVQVWGCAHNTSDAEYMAGLLAAYGYDVTLGGGTSSRNVDTIGNSSDPVVDCDSKNADSEDCECKGKCGLTNGYIDDETAKEASDLWLLNSCTVKGPAEDHFRNAVMSAQAKGKKVVVAGCVPQGSPNVAYLKNVSVVGVQQIDRVVEVVEQTLLGNVVRFLEKRVGMAEDGDSTARRVAGAPLSLPKIRRNPLIEILAISTGCLNACTYCKTKHARGVLASYTVSELTTRAIEAFEDGVKELWLTSEDLGAYGRDLPRHRYSLSSTPPALAQRWPKHLTLVDLLYALVPTIPAGCMLRLGMTNPPYILDQLEEISAVLKHPRVYSFIHIPVQSGSNSVLQAMRREYSVEDFRRVVDFLSEAFSSGANGSCGLTIATDLICGFPTETEADFYDTVHLVERYQFPVLFINQFFARPGTPAASMSREATTAEVKRRTRKLHDLFRTYQPFVGRVNQRYRVLITEASTDGKYWVGHTKAYEQILLPKESQLQGRVVLAEVTQCEKFFMRGRIIDRGPFPSLISGLEEDDLRIPFLTRSDFGRGGASSSGCGASISKSCVEDLPRRVTWGFDSSIIIPVTILLLLVAWATVKMYETA